MYEELIKEKIDSLSYDELYGRYTYSDYDDLIPTDDFYDELDIYVGSIGDLNDFLDLLVKSYYGNQIEYKITHPVLPITKNFYSISEATRYYEHVSKDYEYFYNLIHNTIKQKLFENTK